MFTYSLLFRRGHWALLVLLVLICTTVVSAQITPLRGPPLNQRPPVQILLVPGQNGGGPSLVTIQPRVQLMPGKPPIGPLNNGSLTNQFVYDILPGNLGGNGGGNGGGISGGGGGFSGGGGISGGGGGFSGGGGFGGGGISGGGFGGGGISGGGFGGGGFGGGGFGGGGFGGGGFGGAGFTQSPPTGFGFGGNFAGFGGAMGGPGF